MAESHGKFAVPKVDDLRSLRYRRCGCEPHQIRRSEWRRLAEVALPALAMGYCVFNILNEKTAVGEDGGFCVRWVKRFIPENDYRS